MSRSGSLDLRVFFTKSTTCIQLLETQNLFRNVPLIDCSSLVPDSNVCWYFFGRVERATTAAAAGFLRPCSMYLEKIKMTGKTWRIQPLDKKVCYGVLEIEI